MKVKVKDTEFTFEVRDNLVYTVEKKGSLKCPICDGELLPHNIASYHKALGGYALDIYFKCVDCHALFIFGIPEYDIENFNEAYTAKMVVNEVGPEVDERLKSWGYW